MPHSDVPCGDHCPVEDAIQVIGGKWKLLIIRMLLLEGTRHFNDLQRDVAGISAKVLTENLKDLMRVGIVARQERAGRRVEYSLSEAGRELMPIFEQLGAWHDRANARLVPLEVGAELELGAAE